MKKVYYSILDVAKILEWDKQRTRAWLESAHALVKHNGRFYTTIEMLKTAFPEMYQEVVTSLETED